MFAQNSSWFQQTTIAIHFTWFIIVNCKAYFFCVDINNFYLHSHLIGRNITFNCDKRDTTIQYLSYLFLYFFELCNGVKLLKFLLKRKPTYTCNRAIEWIEISNILILNLFAESIIILIYKFLRCYWWMRITIKKGIHNFTPLCDSNYSPKYTFQICRYPESPLTI